MGRIRVAPTDVEKLPLSDGDWIEVKRDLNNGDVKKLEVAGQKPPTMVDGQVVYPIDWEVYEIERDLIYITDWSLTGLDDKVLKVGRDALRAITPEDFQEIHDAITKHVMSRRQVKNAARAAKAQTEEPPTPSPNTSAPGSDPTST